tara:strand:- start:15 stop:350 length:336 start_codon:yes stop_codon:yes gene_type:complete
MSNLNTIVTNAQAQYGRPVLVTVNCPAVNVNVHVPPIKTDPTIDRELCNREAVIIQREKEIAYIAYTQAQITESQKIQKREIDNITNSKNIIISNGKCSPKIHVISPYKWD